MRPDRHTQRPQRGTLGRWLLLVGPSLLLLVGCAKFNTYFNAKRAFDQAEEVRLDALKKHMDPPKPSGAQRTGYETAIRKSQKILDEYPGHSLTDDVLFLQGKAHHRLEAYRQSIRKLNLLFQNYPATPYLEEALYLQALNYLLIGDLVASQDYLDRLEKNFPDSRFQARSLRVSGDNEFALKDWESAAASYVQYLGLDREIQDRSRVGLKLAECYWELRDYPAAAKVLQEVNRSADSAELAFQARLLQARVLVRMQDYDLAAALVSELKDEAEIYKSSGEVVLVEAEALIAQGRGDEAAPLLETLPAEWQTAAVKARAGEILGNIYLERGKWEDARQKYQAALSKKDVLDDDERIRRLNRSLQDYLAADLALADAKGERVPRLQLLQANAMLFGFERPHMAASLYGAAAVDTAADSTVAARALYGAYVTYKDHLAEPDSAGDFRQMLETRYPSSPQAYEARHDTGGDLLGYLMSMREVEQARNLADLSAEDRAALQEVSDVVAETRGSGRKGMAGVRRRMVYLSRRPNLIFPPPEAAVQAISARQAATLQQEALQAVKQAEFDSLQAAGSALTPQAETREGGLGGPSPTVQPAGRTAGAGANPDSTGLDTSGTDQTQPADTPQTDKNKDRKKKKKQDENWDFLR